MYELLSRSAERPWAPEPVARDSVPDAARSRPLILHMRENRSHLPREGRLCVSIIALLFMITSIVAAAQERWLVPVFSILAIAVLTFALERHGRSAPAQETLELADGRVRHCDSTGRQIDLPAFWLRLATEGRSPSDLRLFLRSRDASIEFGRCLSLDERRAVAPLVEAALAQARRS